MTLNEALEDIQKTARQMEEDWKNAYAGGAMGGRPSEYEPLNEGDWAAFNAGYIAAKYGDYNELKKIVG